MTIERAAYSAAEAAEALGCSVDRVRELCARGEMPGRKLGGEWCIPVRRFERWLEDGDGDLATASRAQKHGRVSSGRSS